MKRYLFGLLILIMISGCFTVNLVYAADPSVYEKTTFEFDYELTSSDSMYDYYTLWIDFSNPEGCDFGLFTIYYCSKPGCSCCYNSLDTTCVESVVSSSLDDTDYEYDFSVNDNPISASLVYTVKVPKSAPVYRFTYGMVTKSDDNSTNLFYNLVGDKILTPAVTPEITPEPTVEPEVSPEPTPPLPQVSVSIGAAYSGDEFTVSSTGTVKSSYTGTAVLEIWARGSEERCVSTTTFESGTASISFSADRYSPYKRFYGKITYTYTDAEGNTQAVVKYTSDDVEIKFQDYVPKDENKIGNLGDLLYYTWNSLLELEIEYEGYSISFKAIILFIICAMAVIVFIKRQFGY